MPPMRNYSPPTTQVSMYPLTNPQPRSAPATYAVAEPQYAPAYTRPASGVCWLVPPGQTVLPDPPSVTVNQAGAVVASTPAGPLYPPTSSAPYSATAYQAAAPAIERGYDQPAFGSPMSPPTSPPVVPVPELPAPYRETARGSSFSSAAPASASSSIVATPASYSPVAYAPPAAQAPVVRNSAYEAPRAPSAFAPAAGGFQLVPAYDIPSTRTNDAAPAQWFEIKRPGDGPIRIGRVSSSCVCIGVRVPNRFIAQGERALVEARVLTRPPANNLTYVIGVNIIEPRSEMLSADVTVRL
jgi:hypothetical protein